MAAAPLMARAHTASGRIVLRRGVIGGVSASGPAGSCAPAASARATASSSSAKLGVSKDVVICTDPHGASNRKPPPGTPSRRSAYAAPIHNCLKLSAFWINSALAARPADGPAPPADYGSGASSSPRIRQQPCQQRIFRSWHNATVLPDKSTAKSRRLRHGLGTIGLIRVVDHACLGHLGRDGRAECRTPYRTST